MRSAGAYRGQIAARRAGRRDPLRADVRAGAHDGFEAQIACQLQITFQVKAAVEVELAGPRFVQVPGHVGLDRIQTHGAQLQQAVFPIIGVDTEVMHGSRKDAEGLAAELKLITGKGDHRTLHTLISLPPLSKHTRLLHRPNGQ